MKCTEAENRIQGSDSRDDAELEKHLQGCEACAAVLEDGGRIAASLDQLGGEEASVESSELFDALSDEIASEQESVRAKFRELPTWLRLLILVGAGFGIGAGVLWLAGREDIGVYPRIRMVMLSSAFVLLMGATLRRSIRPLFRRAEGLQKELSVLGLATLAVVVPAMLPQAHAHMAVSLEGAGADLIPRAFGCFVFGNVTGLPVLGLIWWFSRTDVLQFWHALFGAAAAGLVGNLALQLHCPIVHQEHIFLGHSTVLIFVVAGMWGYLRRRA